MSSAGKLYNPNPEQQLERAVSIMVEIDKPLRERLAEAMIYHLGYINPADLPTEAMRRTMTGIKEDLSIVPSPDGDAIVATTRLLSDGDAQDIARRIFTLYIEVTSANREL
jgi:hypothetical protein